MPRDDAEERLRDALTEADRVRLRERALSLAVSHMSKPNRFTTDPSKIVALANAFFDFLTK
jgi:hypothetical protein